MFDSFGGERLFTSPGWTDSVLTFSPKDLLSGAARPERFLYRARGRGYCGEYQVLDSAGRWRMGDMLECARQSKAPR